MGGGIAAQRDPPPSPGGRVVWQTLGPAPRGCRVLQVDMEAEQLAPRGQPPFSPAPFQLDSGTDGVVCGSGGEGIRRDETSNEHPSPPRAAVVMAIVLQQP